MNLKTICIVAGGTGGHVFPALAVAKELSSAGHKIVWFGTKKGIEAKIIPEAGIQLFFINIKGIRGKRLKNIIMSPFQIIQSIIQSMRLIRRLKPDVMLCMGGFVSGPAGIAAKLMRIPLVIHEQNAIAGTTNRWLSKVANSNLQAFPGALNKAPITVGNPVRTAIKAIQATPGTVDSKLRVLVVGGSLGAQAINALMPKVFALMTDEIQLWHQAGSKNYTEVRASYNVDVPDGQLKVSGFIENMSEAYSWADLVICRSGAMTVSEIAVAAKPAIFVPYPYAIDDHQTANAEWLVDNDAAFLVQQKDLTVEKLVNLLRELNQDRSKLITIGGHAHQVAKFDAADLVVKKCLEVAL